MPESGDQRAQHAPLPSRRRLLRALTLGALAPLLPGCGQTGVLRLGLFNWVGYEALFQAREFGWLPPSAELHDLGGVENILRGVLSGALDAMCLTLDEVVGLAAQIPMTVVAVLDVSAGADCLMAHPRLSSLAALRGQRIGVEPGTLGQLFLVEVLHAAGLKESEVVVVEAGLPEQLALWRSGGIDAAITYHPVAARFAAAGAVSLFDTRQAPETIFDVLAVRNDRIGGRRETISAVIEGHFRALQHIRDNRADALHRLAGRHGVSLAQANVALGGVALPDVAHNRHLLGRDSRLRLIALHIAELLRRRGHPVPELNPDQLFDSRWLPDQ